MSGKARSRPTSATRCVSVRCIASLLYLLVAVVALSAVLRYFRVPRSARGLAAVWRALRRDEPAVQARRAAARAQRESLRGTAIVTLATGDAAARHAIALIKTLRDSGTRVPSIVVLLSRGGMGSADCHNETLRNARNRHYHCSSPLAEADDIVSQRYIDGFARLGASVRIIDPIKDTKYTALIPGGRATFWVGTVVEVAYGVLCALNCKMR